MIKILLNRLDELSTLELDKPEDFDQIKELLNQLSEPRVIQYLLTHYTDQLLSYCEEYDFFTKIALYHTPNDKLRLRLHLFLPGYANRIHHHRWNYAAKILRGAYTQSLYGKKQDFDIETIDISSIKPNLITTHTQGDCYWIHRDYVHSIRAEPNTISLCLRGPSKEDKFWVIDQKAETKWWQYGAKSETYEEKKIKSISYNDLQRIKQQMMTLLGDF